MNTKTIVISLAALCTGSAMAAEPSCQQTIVELLAPGPSATILFPPCAKPVITANQTEASSSSADLLATGNVTISLSGAGILPLTIVTERARISNRPLAQQQQRDIQLLQQSRLTDQQYRQVHVLSKPLSAEDAKRQEQLDQRNRQLLQRMVKQYGWPGFKTVGVDAANAAFLILQHADLATQQQYLPLFRQAVARQDAWPSQLAMLEDRIDVRLGRPQRYGTQIDAAARGAPRPFPLQDARLVDQWRAAVGLSPLAEYLQSFTATTPAIP